MKSVAHCGIRFYQRFLSPLKGFRCAFGVYHDGDSCSEVIRKEIMRQGIFRAVPIAKEQFSKCKEAKYELDHRREELRKEIEQQSENRISDDDGWDGITDNHQNSCDKFRYHNCDNNCACLSDACDFADCGDGCSMPHLDCDLFNCGSFDVDCC